MNPIICLKPIGVVVEGLNKPIDSGATKSRFELISTIKVFDEYTEGLEGLEEYSHIIIIYWMHEARGVKLKGRPWGIKNYPLVGIFATRFPNRPNPIGVTVVELISVEKPLIRVKGLDAWTGTPVLDIKPYDYYDIVKNPKVPWWFIDNWNQLKRKWRYEIIAPWLGPCA